MSFACLCGENVAVLEGDLVGGRQDRLVEEDILYAQVQPVARTCLFGGGIWVAVKENLCANISYALGQLSAWSKDGVERIDVGIDGGCEGRVGCLVLGRVAEQVVSPKGIKLGDS